MRAKVNLQEYLKFLPSDRSSVQVQGGEFTFEEHCQMAYLMWKRLGSSPQELHRAWCSMMQSNPDVTDVMALVAYHVLGETQSQWTRMSRAHYF